VAHFKCGFFRRATRLGYPGEAIMLSQSARIILRSNRPVSAWKRAAAPVHRKKGMRSRVWLGVVIKLFALSRIALA
jgi:hypothetical protein